MVIIAEVITVLSDIFRIVIVEVIRIFGSFAIAKSVVLDYALSSLRHIGFYFHSSVAVSENLCTKVLDLST